MNIGEKIYQLRREHGMTQEMLAEQLVISAQAISKWERGIANPDIVMIPRIAKLFSVSTDELLGIKTCDAQNTELEKRVADLEQLLEKLVAANKSDSEHTDRTTVSELENRLTSLERLLEMLTAKDEHTSKEILLRDAPRLVSFDFTKMSDEDKKKWKPDGLHILDSSRELFMKAIPVPRAFGMTVDPQFIMAGLSIPLNGVSRILIKLSTVGNRSPHQLQVFFITEQCPEWDEQKSIKAGYPNGKKVTLDLAIHNPLFHGVLTGLRIDPFAMGEGSTEIESVMLLTPQGEVVFEMDAEMCKGYVTHLENEDKLDKVKSHGPILKNAKLRPELPGISFVSVPVKLMRDAWDPTLVCEGLKIDANRVRFIHLRIKATLFDQNGRIFTVSNRQCNAEMKLYFKQEGCEDFTEQRKFQLYYLANGAMQDIYIDTSTSGFWHSTVTALRLDPIENQGATFELAQIELLQGTTKVRLNGFMSSLEEKINRLEQDMDELRGEIDSLPYDDCEDLCDELESRIEALENRLESLEDRDN